MPKKIVACFGLITLMGLIVLIGILPASSEFKPSQHPVYSTGYVPNYDPSAWRDDDNVVVGEVGGIEAYAWHIGDDIRVTFYTGSDNSMYFVTDSSGASQLLAIINGQLAETTFSEGRARATIYRTDTLLTIESGDSAYPGTNEVTVFQGEQIAEVVGLLETAIAQASD